MSFEKVEKKLGFGLMRLPMKDDEVDIAETNKMVDAFLDAGFNYFDTAHGYIDGKSEKAVKACLSSRHPRESYVLANKLSEWYFNCEEDIVPLFKSQLEICGVSYFDFYLFHAVNRNSYEKYKSCNAFSVVKKLKEEGKIRHIAMSFHDTADVLDKILSEQPDVEAVQLQINYLDYDDPGVQSDACYKVAAAHGKKVIVMEPVRGGFLANLSPKAAAVFDSLGKNSHASYALRYAASYPEVFMVLSGMGNMEMMTDNIGSMGDFVPLSKEEREATDRVREIIREEKQIKCTKCNYCAEVCPQNIPISGIFEAYNGFLSAKTTKDGAKKNLPDSEHGASDCIGCGKCEKICPQNIEIREHLKKIAEDLK